MLFTEVILMLMLMLMLDVKIIRDKYIQSVGRNTGLFLQQCWWHLNKATEEYSETQIAISQSTQLNIPEGFALQNSAILSTK
jgi:hypothetical protein